MSKTQKGQWIACQTYQPCGCGATARPADHCVCGEPKAAHWIEPEKTSPTHCSHAWIDRDDPPIQRAPSRPVIGAKRHEMKAGTVYVCNNCAAKLWVAK